MLTRPTADEIRSEPAGRRLDAWVSEFVFVRPVVCEDWPCGYNWGCTFEASQTKPTIHSGYDEPHPVRLPIGFGQWPPIRRRDLFPTMEEWLGHENPEVRALRVEHLDEEMAIVEPVPFYSTDIAAAWQVVEKALPYFRLIRHGGKTCPERWTVNRDPIQSWVWRNRYDGEELAEADTVPLVVCRASLLSLPEVSC